MSLPWRKRKRKSTSRSRPARSITREIISADEDADLALLKIEDKTVQFPYFDLTYTSPNLLGETVVALGSPAGYQNSVSHGILSALHRSFTR